MEEQVTIPCGEITLEGRFEQLDGEKGVLIAHPHPLYGGDMNNPVVIALQSAYMRRGFSTLRFNFRGVGTSQGAHDSGAGEQTDIRAGIDFLKTAGIRQIDLAGYSFGAWVIAGLIPSPNEIRRMLLVSPPVAMMDFSGPRQPLLSVRMITGSRDDIAPPASIKNLFDDCDTDAELTILDGADHFYSGHMQQLESAISDAIK